MNQPFDWQDYYYHSKTRIVYTKTEMNIPGLTMFGKHTMTNAFPPLPPHYHQNCFEITLVTNGRISFNITDEEYDLTGCDIFITYPNQVHSTNLAPLSAGEIYWFQLNVEEFQEGLYLNQEASEHLIATLWNLKKHKVNLKNSKVATYIRQAFHSMRVAEKNYVAANLLSLALLQLQELQSNETAEITEDIECVLEYIDAHIGESLSLDELAKVANLSTSQFKQKFRIQIGSAPRHYINYMKIKTAEELLKKGISITETAMKLGFESSSYFAVVFKRYNACSPRMFQNRSEK